MKKAFIVMVGMFILVTALAAEVKIGIVNPALILSKIEKGKEAAKKINDMIVQKQKEGQAMQAEIEKLTKEVSNPALSPDAQQRKAIDLERKRTDLQRFGEDAQREIALMQQRELGPIQEELMTIIQEIAKNEKFTLILDLGTTQQNALSNIVFFDQAIDLSNRVADIYNQRYPAQAKQEPAKKQEQPKPATPPVKK